MYIEAVSKLGTASFWNFSILPGLGLVQNGQNKKEKERLERTKGG